MPRQEIDAREHLADNINSGDVDTAVQSFAQDAIDHDPAPDQGPGRDGFRAYFTALTTAFPDAHIEPAHLVADDEHLARLHPHGHPPGSVSRHRADRQANRGARCPDRPI